jgi:hypothetical protein
MTLDDAIQALRADAEPLYIICLSKADQLARVVYLDDAIRILRAAVPAWVPVSERLPTDGRAYMLRFEDAVFEYNFGRWVDGAWRGEAGQPHIFSSVVTHWMPLPAPPKEAPNVPEVP